MAGHVSTIAVVATVIALASGNAQGAPLQLHAFRTLPAKPDAKFSFLRYAFHSDEEKLVWGWEVEGARRYVERDGRMNIYVNADMDTTTGRFATESADQELSHLGTDYQIQVNWFRKRVDIIHWRDPRPEDPPTWRKHGAVRVDLRLYPDDAYVECGDSVLYLAIKRSAFSALPLKPKDGKLFMRFLAVSRTLATSCSLNTPVPMAPTDGPVLQPTFAFEGFVPQTKREKRELQGDILVKRPDLIVWNGLTQRIRRQELPLDTFPRAPTVELAAARGERESFEIVLTPLKPLHNVRVRMSPLTEPSAQSPAAALHWVGYVKDGFGIEFADPLLSSVPSAAAEQNENRCLWGTIAVPFDCTPGTYAGTVSIRADGMDDIAVPVRLKVWDFALPETPRLRTAFGLYGSGVAKFAEPGQRWQELCPAHYRFFAEHRCGPRLIHASPRMSYDGGKLSVDLSEFDRAAQHYVDDLKIGTFQWPFAQLGSHDFFHGHPFRRLDPAIQNVESPGFKPLWQQYVRAFWEHLKEKGWEGRAFCNVWDEPYTCWRQIGLACTWAKEVVPELRPMVFISHIEPELFGKVDVWTVAAHTYARQDAAPRQKLGEEVWVYNMGGHGPRDGAACLRARYWWAWRDRIDGVLHWCVNHFKGHDVDFMRVNPSPTAIWYYPPVDRHPTSSVRFELVREGLEDYDYLAMLSDAIDGARTRGVSGDVLRDARQALDAVQTIASSKVRTVDDVKCAQDVRALLRARLRIAQAVEKLTLR